MQAYEHEHSTTRAVWLAVAALIVWTAARMGGAL